LKQGSDGDSCSGVPVETETEGRLSRAIHRSEWRQPKNSSCKCRVDDSISAQYYGTTRREAVLCTASRRLAWHLGLALRDLVREQVASNEVDFHVVDLDVKSQQVALAFPGSHERLLVR